MLLLALASHVKWVLVVTRRGWMFMCGPALYWGNMNSKYILSWWSVVLHSHAQGSAGCVCVWKLFWRVLGGLHLLWEWLWLWQCKSHSPKAALKLDKMLKTNHFSGMESDQKHAASWEGFIHENYWNLVKNGVGLWPHLQGLLLIPQLCLW